jgi:type IV secretion system protein VirB2
LNLFDRTISLVNASRLTLDTGVTWGLAFTSGSLFSFPANAQFTKATTALTTLQSWLFGLGITVATLAILFVGYRMMFKRESFADHSHVFWGGLVAAMAPTIAAWFFA